MFIKYIIFLAKFVVLLSTVGVIAAIISMLFGKPIGDDYGAISTYHYTDNWLREAYTSLTTTGRYGQSLVASSLYGMLGGHITTLLPIGTMILFIYITYLYIRYLLAAYVDKGLAINVYSALAAATLSFLALFINDTPYTANLPAWASFQLFFWPSGIITYTLPLLLLLGGIYLLFLSRYSQIIPKRITYILFGLLIFVSSLFNEIQPATLVVTSTALLVFSYTRTYARLWKYRGILLLSAGVSIAGLVALFFSPGRLTRSQFLDTVTVPVEGSLFESTLRNLSTLCQDLYFRPRELVLLTLIGLIVTAIAYHYCKNKQKLHSQLQRALPYILLLPILCLVSVIISFVLVGVGYGYSAGVYSRTLLITQLTYVVTIPLLVFAFSYLFVSHFKQWGMKMFYVAVAIIGALAILSTPNYIGKLLVQVNSSVTYSNLWNEQDAMLKKAAADGKRETVYLDRPATGIGDGFNLTCTGPYAKTTMWLNVQVWEYYGEKEERICAKPETGAAQ